MMGLYLLWACRMYTYSRDHVFKGIYHCTSELVFYIVIYMDHMWDTN